MKKKMIMVVMAIVMFAIASMETVNAGTYDEGVWFNDISLGTGVGIAFVARRDITIRTVGIYLNVRPEAVGKTYYWRVFRDYDQNDSGNLCAMSEGFTVVEGSGWQDFPLDFQVFDGQRYVIHFSNDCSYLNYMTARASWIGESDGNDFINIPIEYDDIIVERGTVNCGAENVNTWSTYVPHVRFNEVDVPCPYTDDDMTAKYQEGYTAGQKSVKPQIIETIKYVDRIVEKVVEVPVERIVYVDKIVEVEKVVEVKVQPTADEMVASLLKQYEGNYKELRKMFAALFAHSKERIITYKAPKAESLSVAATKYNVDVSDIMVWNALSSNSLRKGQCIMLVINNN